MEKTLLNLVEIIALKCVKNNKIIATAESCTGGLLSSYLTALAGSSKYFSNGFITYSNESKSFMLGVNLETIKKYGAVSKETALEMANGCLNKSGSDLAISITGIAGPSGGSPDKPVGLVYFGIASLDKNESFKYNFEGNRDDIRFEACRKALKILINYL